MLKKPMMLLLVVLGIFLFSLGASAQEYNMNGSNATTLTQGTFPFNENIQQVTAEGGNYTEFNVYQDVNTDNWQIFFGDVERNVTLETSGGFSVYDFGSLTINGGYVAFSEANTVDWSAAAACTIACSNAEDTALSLTGVDRINLTFTPNSNKLINLTGAADVLAGTSMALVSLGTGGQSWHTTQVTDGGFDGIYVGHVNSSQNDFLGGSSDFQVMVPTSDAATRNYYVYAALE